MSTTTEPRKVHEGRNLKRIREILQVKQSTLASELGSDWNQKKVSQLEDKETIEPDLLEEVARALKIPVEAIRNFDEEKTIYNISCTFSDNAVNNNAINIQNINPVDKWLEALEEIKKLNNDKVELLERMLKDKNDMIEKLEGLLKERK